MKLILLICSILFVGCTTQHNLSIGHKKICRHQDKLFLLYKTLSPSDYEYVMALHNSTNGCTSVDISGIILSIKNLKHKK